MHKIGHFLNGQPSHPNEARWSDVLDPSTDQVQAEVALASATEVDVAISSAAKAQPAWAAQNPQKRARVIMALVALINRDMDKLAEALSREHGKTSVDAKGDAQHGFEVIEFCVGAPYRLKGEFTDAAGPCIDMYWMRQPLGVIAGITPFNFPAMIPLWKVGPALAAGISMILKPSELAPTVPLMLAELCKEAGLPDGLLQVVNGDKEGGEFSIPVME